jgi:tripartite-type tricarboxylate transporter receptor subunit TctC
MRYRSRPVRHVHGYYASSGVGSANHVDTEVFASLAGVSLIHVPYRDTADGYRALLADEVQVMFGAVTSALLHVEAGKLRAWMDRRGLEVAGGRFRARTSP